MPDLEEPEPLPGEPALQFAERLRFMAHALERTVGPSEVSDYYRLKAYLIEMQWQLEQDQQQSGQPPSRPEE